MVERPQSLGEEIAHRVSRGFVVAVTGCHFSAVLGYAA
jgi:hypothetical protein